MIFSNKSRKRGGYDSMSDAELIALYKKNSENEIIGILFKRYAHQVLGICLKYLKNIEESRDAAMQIFEKLITDLQKHDIENFKSWLLTVAKNYCLMQLRKAKHEFYVEDTGLFSQQAEFMENEEDEHLLWMDTGVLKEKLTHLKAEQKICLELFYFKQKSYQEIAEMTGYDIKKVKSHIQNGKRNLKIMITEQKNDE